MILRREYDLLRARFWVLWHYSVRYPLIAWWTNKPNKRKLGHCFPQACRCRDPNVVRKAA